MTDYRNRITALEYVASRDLLRDAGKIGGDFVQFQFSGLFPQLAHKPNFWHVLVLMIIAAINAVAKWHDICLIRAASGNQGHPMIGGNNAKFVGLSSTDSTRIIPVRKAHIPVLWREIGAPIFQPKLTRAVVQANDNSVFLSVLFTYIQSFVAMTPIGISVFLIALFCVVLAILPVPFYQFFSVFLSVFNGISQTAFALSNISFVRAGVVFVKMFLVRFALLLLDKFRVFLAAFAHVFTAGDSFTVATNAFTMSKSCSWLILVAFGAYLGIHRRIIGEVARICNG